MSKQNTVATSRTTAPIAWSSRLDIQHLGGDAGPEVSAETAANRKRGSSKIEKEIIWAVVVLYAGLIACFAGLHLYALAIG